MIPQITNPLVFSLFAAEMATFVIFVHQAVINALLYRTTQRPELRTYAIWCVWSAVLTVCYLVLHVRFPVTVYEQSFHWLSIATPFAMRYYMAAIAAYLGARARFLQVMITVQPLIAVWPLLSSILLFVGGEQFFLTTREVAPTSMLLQIVNVMAPRNEVLPGFHILVMTGVTCDMIALGLALRTAERRDPWITIGIVFTCVAIAYEATAMRFAWHYAVPVLFAAKLIEVLRITYVSTLTAGREVALLGDEVQRQSATIKAQIEELTAGAELRRLGEQTLEVGHEMRNPIASATLFLRAAQRAAPLDHEISPLLDKIDAALKQLSHLLLKIARRPEPSDHMIDLQLLPALQQAVALCAARMERSGARIEITAPAELVVRARSAAITQVFLNLLTNACDAVQALPDRCIRVEAARRGNRIEVRVTDSGNCSDEALAIAMFKAGFTTKAAEGSLGLGLNICGRVLLELGGSLALDRSSASTCFVVTLPAIDAAPQTGDQPGA